MTRRMVRAVWAEVPAAWESAKTSVSIVVLVTAAVMAPYVGFALHRMFGGAL